MHESSQLRMDPNSQSTTATIVWYWAFLSLLFGKAFAYLNIGGFYVTEMVLVLLIFTGYRRFDLFDWAYLAFIFVYIVLGLSIGGQFVLVGKDMTPFLYLLFFRLAPDNFTREQVQRLGMFVALTIILSLLLPLIVTFFPVVKYRLFPPLVVAYLYFLRRGLSQTFLIPAFIVLCAVISFKTGLLAFLIMPFAVSKRGRKYFVGIWNTKFLLSLSAFFLFLIWSGGIEILMEVAVGVASLLKQSLGDETGYSTGTALWRVAIWKFALAGVKTNEVLFGLYPGSNFLGRLASLGSEFNAFQQFEINSLGVNRSAHNIWIQVVTKCGVLGLAVWISYYARLVRSCTTVDVKIIHSIVLIAGLTSDIYEVPCRGPMFFVLIKLFDSYQARQMALQFQVIPTRKNRKQDIPTEMVSLPKLTSS